MVFLFTICGAQKEDKNHVKKRKMYFDVDNKIFFIFQTKNKDSQMDWINGMALNLKNKHD